MVEPRDYQRFLRASEEAGDRPVGMRGLAPLLPAPPPIATLWSQAGLLIVSAALPAILWLLGKLDPLDVILLYLMEGTAYGLAVLARILFTAAAPGKGERPRLVTALAYLVRHAIVWGGLALLTLVCVAPRPSGVPMCYWLEALLAHFGASTMIFAAGPTVGFLALNVLRRNDYIDAYLELGPHQTARYGHVYPMALAALCFSALLPQALLRGDSMDVAHGLIPTAFFALWLVGWRTAWQLLNLTLPLWGRGLARVEDRFERAMIRAKRPRPE